MSEEYVTNVEIERSNQGLKITYNFRSYFKSEGDLCVGFIPAFNISFSAKTKEEARAKAPAMASLFFDYWVFQQGLPKLAVELHNLGFRAKQDAIVMQMLTHPVKKGKAKLNSSNTQVDDSYAENETFSGENTIAA
jgi:hypothetical protein